MEAKKKTKLDLIDDATLIVVIDIGKRKHHARYIDLRGYEVGKVLSLTL